MLQVAFLTGQLNERTELALVNTVLVMKMHAYF